jgi:alkylhydroperoxidase family enzyme
MARLPYLDADDLADDHRALLDSPINIRRIVANSPGALEGFIALAMYIRRKSPLDPRLRELAIIQVGYLTGSAYEYSHHVEVGAEFGVTDDDVRAIAREAAGEASDLPPLDRAVLRAAREMTADLTISDETWATLEGSLDKVQLVDLVMAIATYNSVVRILGALKVDLEPEYERYLERFPLA